MKKLFEKLKKAWNETADMWHCRYELPVDGLSGCVDIKARGPLEAELKLMQAIVYHERKGGLTYYCRRFSFDRRFVMMISKFIKSI